MNISWTRFLFICCPFFPDFWWFFKFPLCLLFKWQEFGRKKKKYTIFQLTFNQLLETTSKNQNPTFEKPAPSALTFTVYEICCFWNSFCSQCNMERHWWNKVALVSAYIIGSGTTKKNYDKVREDSGFVTMVDILEYKKMKIQMTWRVIKIIWYQISFATQIVKIGFARYF